MLIVEKELKSVIAEEYRKLKSNIQYSSFDKKYKVITLTSANPNEGKSTVSGNLALTLAEGEANVLLIDADTRKPSIHKYFKISNNYGITDILLQKQKISEVIYRYNKNLTIITAGKRTPNPVEMLESNAMTVFLNEMRGKFDYIIIDSPPVQAVADALILSTKSDGVIVVVRAEVTKEHDVENTINALNKVNAKIIGTILFAVRKTRNKYYYYYGSEEK